MDPSQKMCKFLYLCPKSISVNIMLGTHEVEMKQNDVPSPVKNILEAFVYEKELVCPTETSNVTIRVVVE